ncbi:uncharacterized protein LOC144496049 isoform X1 [Mustelus asterias]
MCKAAPYNQGSPGGGNGDTLPTNKPIFMHLSTKCCIVNYSDSSTCLEPITVYHESTIHRVTEIHLRDETEAAQSKDTGVCSDAASKGRKADAASPAPPSEEDTSCQSSTDSVCGEGDTQEKLPSTCEADAGIQEPEKADDSESCPVSSTDKDESSSPPPAKTESDDTCPAEEKAAEQKTTETDESCPAEEKAEKTEAEEKKATEEGESCPIAEESSKTEEAAKTDSAEEKKTEEAAESCPIEEESSKTEEAAKTDSAVEKKTEEAAESCPMEQSAAEAKEEQLPSIVDNGFKRVNCRIDALGSKMDGLIDSIKSLADSMSKEQGEEEPKSPEAAPQTATPESKSPGATPESKSPGATPESKSPAPASPEAKTPEPEP